MIFKSSKCIEKAELRDNKGKLFDLHTKLDKKAHCYQWVNNKSWYCGRALYFEPDIIIMDEPTSSLDTETDLKL